jgi:chorismate dehydratase
MADSLDYPQPRMRIGAVNYLNTVPLVHGLAELAAPAEIVFDLPSRLADRLAEGEFDAALVPSIEAVRHGEWSIVSTACIACRGPVLSVKLFFRKPPEEIATLALDEGSRTSAVLAQILLDDEYGRRPTTTTLPIDADPADCDADAVLVIGDRAIRETAIPHVAVWDLGAKWLERTGLPFVFAVWAARPSVDTWTLAQAFDAARDQGCRDVEAIADAESRRMDLPRPLVLRYLQDHLKFRLGVEERKGFELYCRRAADLGLVPRDAGAESARYAPAGKERVS